MKSNYYVIKYSDPNFDRDCMMTVKMTEQEYEDLCHKLKVIDEYENEVYVYGTKGNTYASYTCGHDFVDKVIVTRISGKQYNVLTQLGCTTVGIPNNIEYEISAIYADM